MAVGSLPAVIQDFNKQRLVPNRTIKHIPRQVNHTTRHMVFLPFIHAQFFLLQVRKDDVAFQTSAR